MRAFLVVVKKTLHHGNVSFYNHFYQSAGFMKSGKKVDHRVERGVFTNFWNV